MERVGGALLGIVSFAALVAMAGARVAGATPPKSLRGEMPMATPPPGTPSAVVPLPTPPPGAAPTPTAPPLSAPAPRTEHHEPARTSHDEGTGCGRSFHTPFDGRLALRGAYRGGKPHAFMFCPSWSSFGTVRAGHRFHGGIDVSAPSGTAVRAAGPGTLSYAHDPGGYGLFARLRFAHPKKQKDGTCGGSGEVEIIYAHLAEGSQKGTTGSRQVRAGEVIGHVGCTGNAKGMCSPSPESHLHVTVQRVDDRKKLDPIAFLGWNVGESDRDVSFSACGVR
jgi:murein DD-endopeptidase MepM/ murein hydrolase activator NlpD